MKKSNESINKAMLQMIIDDSNGKGRMNWVEFVNDNVSYVCATNGYTLYILPIIDCYIKFPIKDETAAYMARYISNIPDDAATVDTNTIVTIRQNGKAFKAYPTNKENVFIKCDLLKGFGNSFTIKETESAYIFAVEIAGNLRGIVMGCKDK